MRTGDNLVAKPFVKWVGGKTQLIDKIRECLPNNMSERTDLIYVEPFIGGGAILFWILQEFPNIQRAVINDINPDLICTYKQIRDNVAEVIDKLEMLQDDYYGLEETARKDYYLYCRSQFNARNLNEQMMAALFIFLNRTCFNGLYRVNSKGLFNVPFGNYKNPKICDKETLIADSRILQKVDILCGDFSQTGVYAGHNAFFYFDPPYRPISETSSFTSYTKDRFDDNDQIRLKLFIDKVSDDCSMFIASNSDPKNIDPEDDFFDNLYEEFDIRRVSATRMINSKAENRGAISEIIITNTTV